MGHQSQTQPNPKREHHQSLYLVLPLVSETPMSSSSTHCGVRMSQNPNSMSSLYLSLPLMLLSFLILFPSSPSASNQTLIQNSYYFQPHNLLVTSRPFKLSSRTSLSSYIAFSFSPNATQTHLALLLFSSKFLPFPAPASENPLPSEEGLVGVVFDGRANNVGVCVGSVDPSVVRDLGPVGLAIGGGEKLRSWVDYDASSKKLEVRVQKSGGEDRPYEPVLAHPVNLSSLWGDGADLMLGISSVSESSSKDGGSDVVGHGSVNVFSWEYRVREVPLSMHSMPVDPSRFPIEHHAVRRRMYWVLGIVVGCVVLAACLTFFVWKMVGSRKIEPAVGFKYEKVHVMLVKKETDVKLEKDGAGS